MDTCKQPVQQMKIHDRKMTFGGENDDGLGDLLIQQVLDGVKTATCDLRCFCTQQEIADLGATPGWMETVVDSAGNPRCNIRVIAVYETSFGNPPPRLVRGEGDGDDVAKFKYDHERWFSKLLNEKGLPSLTDESQLVAWEFELVETFTDA